LLFTDATYDIGASGATRPRDMFLSRNLTVGGTLTLAGGVNLNGNVTVGDAATDTLTINSTITSNLLFTDNTYDIGASGATRPRNLFLAGNATIGGTQTLTGALTVDSTTDSSSATTGSIQTDGGVGIAKALFVGTTVTVNGGTANGVAYLDGSKVLTTGSALTFDGTNLGISVSGATGFSMTSSASQAFINLRSVAGGGFEPFIGFGDVSAGNIGQMIGVSGGGLRWTTGGSEQMRLTSTGLELKQSQLIGYSSYAGIGTNGLAVAGSGGFGTASPTQKLDVVTSSNSGTAVQLSLRNTSNGTGVSAGIAFGFNSVALDPDVLASIYGIVTDRNVRNGALSFFTAAAGTNAERMRVDPAGMYLDTSTGGGRLTFLPGATQNQILSTTASFAAYNTLRHQASSYEWLDAASTQMLTLLASGNLGIGTTNPTYKLQVQDGYVGILRGTGYGSSASIGIDLGAANADAVNNSATYAWGQEVVGDAGGQSLIFKTYRRADTTLERVRIAGNGFFGINTNNPPELLSVVTGTTYAATFNTSITTASSTRISFGALGSAAGGTGGSSAIGNITNHGATAQSSLAFYTHDSTTLNDVGRFDPGRNFLVGVTSTMDGIGSDAKIGLQLSGSVGNFVVQNSADNNIYLAKVSGYTNSTFMQFSVNGTNVGNLTTNGTSIQLDKVSGITFPATQSASSDANTLDDYEEGTWTPIYTGGGVTPTYSEQTGRYIKIGQMVYISFRLVISASSGGSGALKIGGLPFTTNGSGSNPGFIALNFSYGWNSAEAILSLIPTSNATALDAYTEYVAYNANTQTTVAAINAGGTIYIIAGGCYQAAN
jgi:hypothetical protein